MVVGMFIATATVSPTFANNLLANNTFSYIGQPANSNTHLLTLGGYRHYNPSQGTFLKQDSYSPFANNRTFNGFNYSAGNPVLFADQSGHLSVLDSALIAGASILAATFVGIGIYRSIAMSAETSAELVGETSIELVGETSRTRFNNIADTPEFQEKVIFVRDTWLHMRNTIIDRGNFRTWIEEWLYFDPNTVGLNQETALKLGEDSNWLSMRFNGYGIEPNNRWRIDGSEEGFRNWVQSCMNRTYFTDAFTQKMAYRHLYPFAITSTHLRAGFVAEDIARELQAVTLRVLPHMRLTQDDMFQNHILPFLEY